MRPFSRVACRAAWGILLFPLLAVGAGACAGLSSLSEYSAGPSVAGGAEGGGAFGVADAGAGDETGEPSGATGADAVAAAQLDAPDPPADGSASAPPVDASLDADVDAAAICHAQCSGCCDSSGVCHGGQSTTTCGAHGGACRDCAQTGQVCAAGGTCVAASSADSGPPPTCNPTKCTNTCPLLPLAEAPCCKSDQTCGCGAILGILLCN
jgi:hypothetical protein